MESKRKKKLRHLQEASDVSEALLYKGASGSALLTSVIPLAEAHLLEKKSWDHAKLTGVVLLKKYRVWGKTGVKFSFQFQAWKVTAVKREREREKEHRV